MASPVVAATLVSRRARWLLPPASFNHRGDHAARELTKVAAETYREALQNPVHIHRGHSHRRSCIRSSHRACAALQGGAFISVQDSDRSCVREPRGEPAPVGGTSKQLLTSILFRNPSLQPGSWLLKVASFAGKPAALPYVSSRAPRICMPIMTGTEWECIVVSRMSSAA